MRIAQEDVPPPLLGVELHTLDMGLLQAGASVLPAVPQMHALIMEEAAARGIDRLPPAAKAAMGEWVAQARALGAARAALVTLAAG